MTTVIYTAGLPMGVAYYMSIYDLTGHNCYIHMHVLMLYTGGETPKYNHYQPHVSLNQWVT